MLAEPDESYQRMRKSSAANQEVQGVSQLRTTGIGMCIISVQDTISMWPCYGREARRSRRWPLAVGRWPSFRVTVTC